MLAGSAYRHAGTIAGHLTLPIMAGIAGIAFLIWGIGDGLRLARRQIYFRPRFSLSRRPRSPWSCRFALHFDEVDRTTGDVIIKYPDHQTAGVPGKGIEISAVLFQDRPIFMLVMTVDDVAGTVAGVIAVIIELPDQVFRVLLLKRAIRIDAGMDIDPMLVEVHQWKRPGPVQMLVGRRP